MKPDENNIYNNASILAGGFLTKVRARIKEQVGGVPLGMKPKSTREQLEWYLKLTPVDKTMLYQQYGHEPFVKMVTDMEKLLDKSDTGFRSHYGIEKEM